MTEEVAVTPGVAMARKCGARTRSGGQCARPAGWGTSHVGFASCKLHGGCTPYGAAYGARLAALDAVGPLGGEVDVNPLDALLFTVRRASGLATYYRLQAEIASYEERDVTAFASLEREALGDLAKWSKMAIDAGVAERMVRIAEGTGERLASALEDALEGIDLSPDQRRGVVARFAASLGRLEREQPAITATATDA